MMDASELMLAIENDCEALDRAAKELEDLTSRFVVAEIKYEDAMDAALIEVEDEYRKLGVTLPSERQREARARQKLDHSLRRSYLEAGRRKGLIQTWGDMRAKALSGRQSQLSFLKSEGTAPTGPQPQWGGH